MMNRTLSGVLIAAVLLAGCSGRPASDDPAAAAAVFAAGQSGERPLGMAAPANYPKDVKMPADAFVTSVTEGAAGPTSGEVVFSTAHPPAAVAKAYLDALQAAGFDAKETSADGGASTVSGARGSRRISVTSARLDGVGSEVTLAYR